MPKISELAAGGAAQATDAFVVVRAGANFQLTLADIADGITFENVTIDHTASGGVPLHITGVAAQAANYLEILVDSTHYALLVDANSQTNMERLVVDHTNIGGVCCMVNGISAHGQNIFEVKVDGTYIILASAGAALQFFPDMNGSVFVGNGSNPNFYVDVTTGKASVNNINAAETFAVRNTTNTGTTIRYDATLAGGQIPNQCIYMGGVDTTDATPTAAFVIGIGATYAYLIEAQVIARWTGGVAGADGDAAGFILRAVVTRPSAGSPTVIGAVDSFARKSNAALDATIQIDGSDNIEVLVTGDVDNNYTWHVVVTLHVIPGG